MSYFAFLVIILLISQLVSSGDGLNVGIDGTADGSSFRCDYSYNPYVDGWFKLHLENTKVKMAKHKCEQEGAALWSPTSTMIKMAVLMQMGYQQAATAVLVDMRNNTSNDASNDKLEEKDFLTFNEHDTSISHDAIDSGPCYVSGPSEVENEPCGGYDREYHFYDGFNNCYKLHRVRNIWDDARSKCESEGGHLVIINTDREASLVQEMIRKNPPITIPGYNGRDTVFIGATLKHKHDLTDWENMNGDKVKEVRWNQWAVAPNNTYEICGAVDQDVLLHQESCTRELPYICQRLIIDDTTAYCKTREGEEGKENIKMHSRKIQFTCPTKRDTFTVNKDCGGYDLDYIRYSSDGHCYKFHSVRDNWEDAKAICEAEGGHLVTIRIEGEALDVRNILHANAPKPAPEYNGRGTVFIGIIMRNLNDLNNLLDWETVEGETLADIHYNTWAQAPSSTEESCGSVDANALLHQESCTRDLPYICERPFIKDTAAYCAEAEKKGDMEKKNRQRLHFVCSDKDTTPVLPENDICGGYDLGYQHYGYVAGVCHKVHNVPDNWDDAKTMCENEDARLVIIDNENQALTVKDALYLFPPSSFPRYKGRDTVYIGMKLNHTHNVSEWETVEGVKLDDAGWNVWIDLPNNTDESCAALDRSVLMHQETCTRELPYICERQIIYNTAVYCEGRKIVTRKEEKELQTYMADDGGYATAEDETLPFICYKKESTVDIKYPNKDCGGDDKDYILNNGSCYKFHRVRDKWVDAKGICEIEGGNLLIMNTYKEAQVVQRFFHRNPPASIPDYDGRDTVFIGMKLRRPNNYNDWVTVDGKNLTETGWQQWGQDMPHKTYGLDYCGSVDRSGLLQQDICLRRLPFICERDIIYNNTEYCEDWKTIPFYISSSKHSSTFRCDYTYIPLVGGWFKLHTEPTTWQDARTACRREATRLMYPNNGLLMAAVQYLTRDFTNVNTVLIDPNDKFAIRIEQKAMRTNNMTFVKVKSTDTFPFICHIEGKKIESLNEFCDSVDEEYFFNRRTQSCYKLNTNFKSWLEARATCQAEGGDLAVINSDEEARTLQNLFAQHPKISSILDRNNWAFVGIYYDHARQAWLTVNDILLKNAGYEKWIPGEPTFKGPNLHCALIGRNGSLLAVPCYYNMAAFCKKQYILKDIDVCEDSDRSPHFTDHRYASRFRCDYSYFGSIGGWLKMHHTPTTNMLARKTCYVEGAELVSPLSDGLKAAIHVLMWSGKYTPEVHIDRKDYSFKLDGLYTLSVDGMFSNTTNRSMLPFICHKRADQIRRFNEKCRIFNDDYTFDNRTGNCYTFHFESTTWPLARAVCQAEGGDLAVINSDTEAEVMQDFFNLAPPYLIHGDWTRTSRKYYEKGLDLKHVLFGQNAK